MKNFHKIFSLLVGLLIWGIASSCGAAAYYATVEQPEGEVASIKSAAEFNIKPIDFSAINYKDLGYTNSAEWEADCKDVPTAFAEAFPILLKEGNITNKTVSMLSDSQKVRKGIIVEVAVTKIILNYNFMTAQPDDLVCKINFINAATGQKIYSGTANINSRSGNPYAQAWKASFSNRLQTASYNIAWVLTKIMVQGKIEPAVY